jgi:hypothetical protein
MIYRLLQPKLLRIFFFHFLLLFLDFFLGAVPDKAFLCTINLFVFASVNVSYVCSIKLILDVKPLGAIHYPPSWSTLRSAHFQFLLNSARQVERIAQFTFCAPVEFFDCPFAVRYV